MKTTTRTRRAALPLVLLAALAASLLGACGSPPYVLVDQKFLGPNKTAKVLMQQSTEGLFHEYIRVCDLTAKGEEVNCKDTLVLENVQPWSIY